MKKRDNIRKSWLFLILLLLIGCICQALFIVFSGGPSNAGVHNAWIVNPLSYLCLLTVIMFSLYHLVLRLERKLKQAHSTAGVKGDETRFLTSRMALWNNRGNAPGDIEPHRTITTHKESEKTLQHRIRELTLLNQMNIFLQTCRAEKDTYHVVCNICEKLFPMDSGCLCIMDDSRTKSKVVDFWGIPPTQPSTSDHQEYRPFRPGKPSAMEDLDPGALCPHLSFYPNADCLCVPINISGDMLGMLSLCVRPQESGNSNGTHAHTMEAKRTMLTQIAEHYALALANLRLRESLRMESIRDPLTGLYNRRYMEESLQREACRAKRHHSSIGIIMLDIDHFKDFNDIYGHEVGDMVLQELGALLQKYTRSEDIACRYGGDEFLLILPEASLEVSRKRAEELRLRVKELRIHHRNTTLRLTISFGLSVLSNGHSEVKAALAAADKALYQAKNSGRDQVAVDWV